MLNVKFRSPEAQATAEAIDENLAVLAHHGIPYITAIKETGVDGVCYAAGADGTDAVNLYEILSLVEALRSKLTTEEAVEVAAMFFDCASNYLGYDVIKKLEEIDETGKYPMMQVKLVVSDFYQTKEYKNVINTQEKLFNDMAENANFQMGFSVFTRENDVTVIDAVGNADVVLKLAAVCTSNLFARINADEETVLAFEYAILDSLSGTAFNFDFEDHANFFMRKGGR